MSPVDQYWPLRYHRWGQIHQTTQHGICAGFSHPLPNWALKIPRIGNVAQCYGTVPIQCTPNQVGEGGSTGISQHIEEKYCPESKCMNARYHTLSLFAIISFPPFDWPLDCIHLQNSSTTYCCTRNHRLRYKTAHRRRDRHVCSTMLNIKAMWESGYAMFTRHVYHTYAYGIHMSVQGPVAYDTHAKRIFVWQQTHTRPRTDSSAIFILDATGRHELCNSTGSGNLHSK